MKHLPFLLTGILSLSFGGEPGEAFAQNPASLDLSFDPGTGTDFYVITTAVQSDGKIIIGGWFTSYNGTPRNYIARLNSDGSLDATFDPGTGADYYVQSVSIQSDGKIIVGGAFTSYNGTPRNRIARLNADGSLDATFDPGDGADGTVSAAAIQSDGRIVIVGAFTSYDGTPRNAIARINADGSLDATFDPGIGAASSYPFIFDTAIQSDGRIVIGGNFTFYDGTPRNHIARLNGDGSLDTTFNPGTGAGDEEIERVSSISVQSDGKIFIGGLFGLYNGVPSPNIARLNADGSLDTTFDVGEGASSQVTTAVIQNDGRIVIGGSFTFYNGTPRSRIARLNADGSLDTTFYPDTGADNAVTSTVEQSDGKIIICGFFTSYGGTPRNYVARLNGGNAVGMNGVTSCQFSIFPNPASSSVSILMPEQLGRPELLLRNALGQELLRSTLATGRNEIPLSGFGPGLYSLQVGAAAQRLVVE